MTHFYGMSALGRPADEATYNGILEHGSWALMHAPDELRSDRNFVGAVVSQNGVTLLYASHALRNDREVVLAAVGQNGHAMRHASDELLNDRSFALEAVARHSDAIMHLPASLRNDHDFVLEAVRMGCPLEKVPAAQRAWMLRRQELLATMKDSIDQGELCMLCKVVSDGETHGLLERDLEEARTAIKRLQKYSSLTSLLELLFPSSTGIPPAVLLKGSWLADFAESGGILPSRQDLPVEAVWGGEELKRDVEEYESQPRQRQPHKIIAISYCWLQEGHPDPEGAQFKLLGQLIRCRLRSVGDGVDLAIYIDYCSVFQEPRSELETAAYNESLDSMHFWFAHEKPEKWLLSRVIDVGARCSRVDDVSRILAQASAGGTLQEFAAKVSAADAEEVLPYTDRGWPCFERALAEFLAIGAGAKVSLLDMGKLDGAFSALEWPEIQRRCRAGQAAPQIPEAFCAELAGKTFRNPSDLAMLQEKYRVTFNEVVACTLNLIFCNLDWGDEEVVALASTLTYCSQLQSIDLEGNNIGDTGVASLLAALPGCPKLTRVILRRNRIGDVGAQHIAAQLPFCKQLEELDLSFNVIGNEGAGHLAAVFERTAHPRLRELRLNSNDVGAYVQTKLRSSTAAAQPSNFTLYL